MCTTSRIAHFPVLGILGCAMAVCGSHSGISSGVAFGAPDGGSQPTTTATTASPDEGSNPRALSGLTEPGRLEADGEPIDIGQLSSIAHAGPWIADVDGDGDRDLLVGDFPGYFWLFDNVGSDEQPEYTSTGKLQAGGVDAKTPVY